LSDLFGGLELIDLTSGSFVSITSLTILDDLSDEKVGMKICACLPALPALTHICVSEYSNSDVLKLMLASCPRLEVLVYLWSSMFSTQAHIFGLPAAALIGDIPLVVVLSRYYGDSWESAARGLLNFWGAAGDFVARKRSDIIERKHFWSIAGDTTHSSIQVIVICWALQCSLCY
jgi:hypothetical protein